jgi:ribosomal protein L13
MLKVVEYALAASGDDDRGQDFRPKGKPDRTPLGLVDANDQILGRLATQIAEYLLGKHKPEFTPGVDVGDFVVV